MPRVRSTMPSAKSRAGAILKRQQVRDHLLGEITMGRVLPGQMLPTEVDIARQLSVSRNTVRQALGNLEEQGLIRRVQGKGTFASERPVDQPASGTASFALVVIDVGSGYYRGLFAAFEKYANDVGRRVAVCNSGDNLDRQGNHILSLLDQQVAGVVLNPSSTGITPSFHVGMLQKAGIPVVLLHRPVPHASAPVLQIPGLEIGRRAAEILADAGHRDIAFVSALKRDTGQQILAGIQGALSTRGIDLPDHRIVFCSQSYEDIEGVAYQRELEERTHTAMKALMSSSTRPSAILVEFAETAESVYLAALRLGLNIPKDLSIVCAGALQNSGAILNRLTTVTVDQAAAALQAVELLVEMTDRRRSLTDASRFHLPIGYCSGETLGPPPAN